MAHRRRARPESQHAWVYAFNLTSHQTASAPARDRGHPADCRELLAACGQRAEGGVPPGRAANAERRPFASRQGWNPHGNPAFPIGRHIRLDDEPGPRCALTRDEASTCSRVPPTDVERSTLCVRARTGMRLGELLALQWGDLDFAAGSSRCAEISSQASSRRRRTRPRRVDMSLQLTEGLRRPPTSGQSREPEGGQPAAAWVFTTRR